MFRIHNYTDHRVVVFSKEDTRRDRSGNVHLIKPLNLVKPNFVVEPSWAFNAHKFMGQSLEFNCNGITFKTSKPYTVSLDPIDITNFGPDDIAVVSSKYAHIAKNSLSFNVVDRLFTMSDVIKDKKGKVIGCVSLKKVGPIMYPTHYLMWPSDSITKKLAVVHWRKYRNSLNLNEQAALKQLEEQEFCYREETNYV